MEFLIGSEKKLLEFISNLEAKDKIALISHNDGDGFCSALIISKIVGEVESIDFMGYTPHMLRPFVEKFKKLKINKIIITDINVDEDEESIRELEKFAEILVIDHHPIIKDLNSNKTIMLKTKSEFPAAYTCYKLFSGMQKLPCWIGVLGTLLDNMHKYTKDNVEALFDDFEFGAGCEKGDYRDKAILLSNTLIYFRGKENELFEILKNSKDFSDLDTLREYSDFVEDEIQHFLEDFEKNKDEKEDLVFYAFDPKYPITSALINIISVKDRAKTYVIVTRTRKLAKASCRSQEGKVDCPALLKKAIEDIPSSTAGGHFKAAGATMPVKYFGQFKENLFKAYGDLV